MRLGLLVLLVSALTVVTACGRGDTLWHRGEPDGVTVCLNGAGGDRHPGNQAVNGLCDGLPGLVVDCSRGDCRATFPFSDTGNPRAAITAAVDEGAPLVTVIGYSWGGVNAVEVARSLELDDVTIDRMVLIDAFSPVAERPLRVPANVRRLWSYRHSVAAETDCSRDRPFIGPYLGIEPACAETTRCLDYDYSLHPEVADIAGHCTVAEMAVAPTLDNVLGGFDSDDARLPPPVVIATGEQAE